MANPSTVILQLVAAVANGIALSQAVAGAGALTLNGSLVTGGVAIMDVARRIIIASAGADSAVIFTVKGTSRDGNVQTETITGVATPTPVQSVLDYKTVTSITASGATAGNITAGTNGVGSSVWVVDDFLVGSWSLAGNITGPAGTTYTLEYTIDDPNDIGRSLFPEPQQFSMNPASFIPPHVYAYNQISGASGDNRWGFPEGPIFAHRLTINSGTGQVVMQSIQGGVGY